MMTVYEVTVTDGGDFDAVRFNALYRDMNEAWDAGEYELKKAKARYDGDDMAGTFKGQIELSVTTRRVL